MMNGDRRILIVPIGLELARALVGLKEYNPDLVYVMYSNKEGKEANNKIDAESNYFKDKFAEKIKGLWNSVECGLDVTNLSNCIKILMEIIQEEMGKDESCHFFINVSSSSKIFSFASIYLAGKFNEKISLFYAKPSKYLIVDLIKNFENLVSLIKESKSYNENRNVLEKAEEYIERYKENGWTIGPYELLEIPYYKISKYSEEEIRILETLEEKKGKFSEGFSIEDILKTLDRNTSDRNEKQRLNYYLNELEKNGFIDCTVINRKKYSQINKVGQIFLENIAPLVDRS